MNMFRIIRKTGRLLLFIASFIFLLTGCGQFQEVQISQISGVKILKMTNKGIDLEIGLKIKNPNPYAFTIYRSSFNISLGGTDLGLAKLMQKEKVAANSEDSHTFKISTTFDKLAQGGLSSLFALFGSRKNAEIQIKGNLKVGRFLIRKSIPVDKKQRVNLDNKATGSLFNLD